MRIRRRSIELEAMQWTGSNPRELIDFCRDAEVEFTQIGGALVIADGRINLLRAGHYVVRSDFNGAISAVPPDAFRRMYEVVDE